MTSMNGCDAPKLPTRKRERAWTGRVLCFAACVVAVNALIGERGLSETLRAQRDFNAAVAELSRLQYENATLAEMTRRLQYDAPMIEHVARAELGLIKPGEILVVVKSSATAASTTSGTAGTMASLSSLTKTGAQE
jgi:cell division protein FtsB